MTKCQLGILSLGGKEEATPQLACNEASGSRLALEANRVKRKTVFKRDICQEQWQLWPSHTIRLQDAETYSCFTTYSLRAVFPAYCGAVVLQFALHDHIAF
jgi:hypothetical protein